MEKSETKTETGKDEKGNEETREKGSTGPEVREIVDVELDSESVYDDCTSIERVEYEWESERISFSPEKIYDKIQKGEGFYILDGGEKHRVKAVEMGVSKYIRVLDSDTGKDPLVELAKDREKEEGSDEESDSNKSERDRSNTKKPIPDGGKPDYTAIADGIVEALVDTSSDKVSKIETKEKFSETVSEKSREVDGVRRVGSEIVVKKGKNQVYDDVSEPVFHLFYEAMEEHAQNLGVSMHSALEVLEDRLEGARGSESFLGISVVKPAKSQQVANKISE